MDVVITVAMSPADFDLLRAALEQRRADLLSVLTMDADPETKRVARSHAAKLADLLERLR